MKLHELQPNEGKTKNRKRVGRGISAGQGKTAGRGMAVGRRARKHVPEVEQAFGIKVATYLSSADCLLNAVLRTLTGSNITR
jgi:hypothetical protein